MSGCDAPLPRICAGERIIRRDIAVLGNSTDVCSSHEFVNCMNL
jgi:hypothetical protein